MTFPILCATIMCERDSKSKWRCISVEDGALLFDLTSTDFTNYIIFAFLFMYIL